MAEVLPFSEATRRWLADAFLAPTPAQAQAWQAIARGEDTLVIAPTGSGKTLAAFLWALDRLIAPDPAGAEHGCRVVYVSPLRALAVDVDRNLRSPLTGITLAAQALGQPVRAVSVALRTGDTTSAERAQFTRSPADILITTPESLFLLLTSRAREGLRAVDTVIVDEVHALAGSKRGAHLAVSLDRLDALLPGPAQRIGLSATVNPAAEVARYLRPSGAVSVVAPPVAKQWDLRVAVPVADMAAMGEPTGEVTGSAAGTADRVSIWPHLEGHLRTLIGEHRSTLVFVNSRRLAERLTGRLNGAGEEPAPMIARAHHGSVSREQRSQIEEELKAGRLPAVVATNSLELGIDMGAIDLVVQVASPPSVASGVQRVGRAGHQVGATSRGVILPTHRGDLAACAVVVERMQAGLVEGLRIPVNPLDVLAQQIVAMVALEDWTVTDLAALLRRSAPFTGLPDSLLMAVLDMLAGRYPSDAFAELRPRLVWDRATGVLRGRPGAQRLAVTSGGTIPDRGLFSVILAGERGSRVGELDEEMVYEMRAGEIIALGASSWRVEQITHDRVLVSPAPGQPGRTPFWRGDAPGRPADLGRAVGELLRSAAGPSGPFTARLTAAGLDEQARTNLREYLAEQRRATGRLPDDRTIVVEAFRDEIGDWRVVVHSPHGATVHAPWALLIASRLRQRHELEVSVMHADDGIVIRLPDTDAGDPLAGVVEALVIDPEEVAEGLKAAVGGSALFASRFREAAARALLLPRRIPGRRTPLWQQRQRAAHLLEVASRYPDFPIVLEAVRECLTDVYDLPALTSLLTAIGNGEVSVIEVLTDQPSPFARSLLHGYVATFIYDGDAPLAERRAQALSLDSGLLAELLGTPELRDLLDADAIAEVVADVGHLTERTRARTVEDAADLLRILGPLTPARAAGSGISADWLTELCQARRAIRVRIAGEECTAAIEDAGRLRDALGVVLPPGIAAEFTEPVPDPLADVVARYARTHGPFPARSCAAALGLPVGVVHTALRELARDGRVAAGHYRPGEVGEEWCDPEVLRRIRRRSIARLRAEAEPQPPAAFARFLFTWQQLGSATCPPPRTGIDGLMAVIDQLAGIGLPAPVWERAVLPARVRDYDPSWLDALTASGEVRWWGNGRAGRAGVVALAPAELAPALLPMRPATDRPAAVESDLTERVSAVLAGGGGFFFEDIVEALAATAPEHGDGADPASAVAVGDALWALVWQGRVTNDSWAALRASHPGRTSDRPRRVAGHAGHARPLRGRRGPRPLTGGLRGLARHPMAAAGSPWRGLPTTAGRWSLLRQPTLNRQPSLNLQPSLNEEERTLLTAEVLLGRWGILTRTVVASEPFPGGFAALYPILSALEHTGAVQRTYAVEGLGAAQFALPTAVDRLRSPERGGPAEPAVLSAVDPAVLEGAVIPWPALPDGAGRPLRTAGAWVVVEEGRLLAYLARGGSHLLAWTPAAPELERALRALAASPLLATGPQRRPRLALQQVNGAPIPPAGGTAAALRAAGFLPSPAGWVPAARVGHPGADRA